MQQTNFYQSINGIFAVGAANGADAWQQDRGLAYGHGLFETMRYQGALVPLRERHVKRLCSDAAVLGISLDRAIVDSHLGQFIEVLAAQKVEAGVIKILATAGNGGRGYQSPEIMALQIICQYSSFDAEQASDQRELGIKLWRCAYRLPSNTVLAGIKHLNRLDQVLARSEWSSSEFADGIMLDAHDSIIEATSANIFVRTAQGWVTPSLEQAGVAGVMRALLIEHLFMNQNLSVSINPVLANDLEQALELFVCNSVRGIIPVTHIAGVGTLPGIDISIGDQTRMLQSALGKLYPCYL